MLEKYFSSPIPTLLKRVWSSISGKPYSVQTSSEASSENNSRNSASSNIMRQSTKSTNSISSFAPWSKQCENEDSNYSDENYKAKLRSAKEKRFKSESLKLTDKNSCKQLDFMIFND
jgi:hypothetical protein